MVQLCLPEGKTFSYFTFSESFVDAVGTALPFGLSPTAPAYLKVFRLPGKKTWRIFALYVNSERGILLWETDKPPDWIPDKFH